MSNTTKSLSKLDFEQVIQGAGVQEDLSIGTSGYLVGQVGRKIELAISTTNVANDTETYSYSENGSALYTIKVIYTTGARTLMLSAERTA